MARLDYTQPPESLAEELREVAGDARAMQEALRRSNGLPGDFPAQQLDELLTGLQTLVDGTAEGCREPLTYARARLPQIRREYILTEARSAGAKVEGDQVPPLMRGETIDKALSALMTSVSTALDEYRRLAGESGLDEVDTSSSQTIDQNAPDVQSAIKAASSAENQLDAAKDEVKKLVKPDSVKGDELKRQLTDARGLYRLARIELRMPQFVQNWFEKAVAAVKDYPTLLKKTASGIRSVADLVERGYNVHNDVTERVDRVWQYFVDQQLKVLTSTMRKAAEEMEGFADSHKRGSAENQRAETPGAAPDAGTPPDDFDLDKVREDILAGREPKPEWRPWVIELDLSNTGITNLAPLRNLINLHKLNLTNTPVADIEPLKKLVSLQTLSLWVTSITDIEPLKQLINLQDLDLTSTQVADIEPLKQLVNLQFLYISGTQVADIEPLKQLVNLQVLYISGTQVADIGALKQLVNLQVLYISGTQVADIGPLKQLVKLQVIDLSGTNVADIKPLKQLFNLRDLHIRETKIDDLSPLTNLQELRNIFVEENRVAILSRTLRRRNIIR